MHMYIEKHTNSHFFIKKSDSSFKSSKCAISSTNHSLIMLIVGIASNTMPIS